jgi:hypothetical protein
MFHQITGFYFYKNYVIYSTKYESGRYCSMHDRTGLTDEQAMGKFIIEHSKEVDYLIRDKKQKDSLTIKN